jgi:hypothetical protein
MSIAFRLKYALGLIPSADQLDAKWENLIKMRDDLVRMEASAELKQYEDLRNLVESTAFQHSKREIESLQYSGSEEEKLMLEYKDLSRSKAIRNYQKLAGSIQLDRFGKILSGSNLKRFTALQQEVESQDFLQRRASQKRREFLKSPDHALLKEFNQLRKSDDISFWRKFGHSESYLSYLKTVDSRELARLEELGVLTASSQFQERVAYLKDKKRYLKSDGYKKIVDFNNSDKSSFMFAYRKLKKAKELEFFENWEVIFEENFSDKKLNTELWQHEDWWGYQHAGVSFSQEGQKQGYHGLPNIEISNNTLSIWSKKERMQGSVWNPAIGILPKQFDYTSAILNSAKSFRLKEGVVEARVRFRKDATIVSAFSLTGEKPFPQVDLFRSTKNGIGMGILEKNEAHSSKYRTLNGHNDSHFHIYRLEIFGNELVWKINGTEVFRHNQSLTEPLFFHLLTTLHGEVNEHMLPHRFEIDWIRCLAKKN